MEINLIAAVSENNVIGYRGEIPWRIKEDIKHFKKLTIGHPVIMGRKTYESIPERFRPLPGRLNIVLSHNSDYLPKGPYVFKSLEEAIDALNDSEPQEPNIDYSKIFLIGGTSVYEQGIGIADKLEITHVHRQVQGDAYFPAIDLLIWHKEKGEKHDGFEFATYIRK